MKYVKMLGLAAVAAMAVMAFLGASSASAVVLCEEPAGSGCETPYPSGTAIHGETSNAVLNSSLGTVECESLSAGKTTAESGNPLPGLIEKLTFSNCHLGTTSCTAESVHLPYRTLLTYTSGNNGTMTVESDGGGAPGANVKCGSIISCTFTAEGIQLDALGGAPGSLVANKETLSHESGLFCPSTSTWTATYTIDAPNPLYVASS